VGADQRMSGCVGKWVLQPRESVERWGGVRGGGRGEKLSQNKKHSTDNAVTATLHRPSPPTIIHTHAHQPRSRNAPQTTPSVATDTIDPLTIFIITARHHIRLHAVNGPPPPGRPFRASAARHFTAAVGSSARRLTGSGVQEDRNTRAIRRNQRRGSFLVGAQHRPLHSPVIPKHSYVMIQKKASPLVRMRPS